MENNIKNWFLNTQLQSGQNSWSEKVLKLELSKNRNQKVGFGKLDKIPEVKSNKHINVSSPFYDRNKVCKAVNCKCPYHRRMRYL